MSTDRARQALVAAAVLLALAGPACRRDMFNQPKVKPLSASRFFDDGAAARLPIEGTVARDEQDSDARFYRGLGPDGKFTADLPVKLSRALLERGRERFEIFCSPCHGRLGDGQGMIVRRGFKAPPSYHVDRLRAQPIGYLFDVATNGFGEMSGYAAQVPPQDRWAIAAYIRALQLSQHAPAGALSPEDRAAVERALVRP